MANFSSNLILKRILSKLNGKIEETETEDLFRAIRLLFARSGQLEPKIYSTDYTVYFIPYITSTFHKVTEFI